MQIQITPAAGAHAYGTIGAFLLVYKAELTLTGYFMEMQLPCTVHVDFSKDPTVTE